MIENAFSGLEPVITTVVTEEWKEVVFDFDHTNHYHLWVSNLGRVKVFNHTASGRFLRCSDCDGYKIIRIRFFAARNSVVAAAFKKRKTDITNIRDHIQKLRVEDAEANAAVIETATNDLREKCAALRTDCKSDEKSRTIYYHQMVHRLVAQYFLHRPSALHTIVAHLDYDKLNNRAENLAWMTREENFRHQQSSPHVICARVKRKERSSMRQKS